MRSEHRAQREDATVGTADRASAINTTRSALVPPPSANRDQLLVKTVISFTSAPETCQSTRSWKCAAHFRTDRRLRASGPQKVRKGVFGEAKRLLNCCYRRFGRVGDVSTALVSEGGLVDASTRFLRTFKRYRRGKLSSHVS